MQTQFINPTSISNLQLIFIYPTYISYCLIVMHISISYIHCHIYPIHTSLHLNVSHISNSYIPLPIIPHTSISYIHLSIGTAYIHVIYHNKKKLTQLNSYIQLSSSHIQLISTSPTITPQKCIHPFIHIIYPTYHMCTKSEC